MKKLIATVGIATMLAIGPAAPGHAAAPVASCVGQELSILGPMFGSGVGAALSFEARNPELEGHRNFGEEVSSSGHADRTACPEE
jgi:hypothetical protein